MYILYFYDFVQLIPQSSNVRQEKYLECYSLFSFAFPDIYCHVLMRFISYCFAAPRLLCLVLWLAIAPGPSPSVEGATDRDLMLPLHSEFRREQPEQRHLFDVNLFDEPDERYEDYPIETWTWHMWVLTNYNTVLH